MEKKGLLVMLAVAIMATMVMVQLAEAETSEYWQGYDLGYYHGRNHMNRVYPASAYHTDYLRGYDHGHVDGWYNHPSKVHYSDYRDYEDDNYGSPHDRYPRRQGRLIFSVPLPPTPPWFRR